LPVSSPSPRLDRCGQAMESLYGSFSNIEDPNTWTPPPRSGGHRGRYLWTDAFGVVNFLTMHQEYKRTGNDTTGDDRYLVLAGRLIETVHDVLGKTRDGRSRLRGATDENPLSGGLRIGKTDARGPDGDGQYHHYLTVWMFALNRMAKASGDLKYNRQAIELAKAIHPRFFVDRAAARPRMIWKMSMDLSEPLVKSEGNLDPIDGFVVFRLLQDTAMEAGDGAFLAEEIDDYRRTMERKGEHFVSSDPLDLGMTLWTAHWFSGRERWAADLAGKCFEQIYNLFEINQYLERNIKFRLAFREFGTCMGIQCQSEVKEKERTVDLKCYSDAIIAAWDPYMQLSISDDLTPADLRPITRVMYASALIPGGKLSQTILYDESGILTHFPIPAFQAGFLGPEPTPT
ncbi:Pc13g02450, partial [Penicillium rubens Wisconsin 54-1255]